MTDDACTPNRYSSDSWGTPLLCSACEADLNLKYDSYGISVFRAKLVRFHRGDAGVTISGIDRQRLRMFFLSILWRISVSTHKSYSNIDLPEVWEEEIRCAILSGNKLSSLRFHVAVYKLNDSTGFNGFSNENMRGMVVAPFAREFRDFISVCFLFLGFFVEIFLPCIPKYHRGKNGVLHGSSNIFLAPYLNFYEIPELLSMLVAALDKDDPKFSPPA
jgi:hypothetical protein